MSCPSLESLWLALEEGASGGKQHLESCPRCAGLLEAHRQLEKDLGRLVDPPPPADFVTAVMAKVDVAPLPLRRELFLGAFVFAAAALLIALFGAHEGLAVDSAQRALPALGVALVAALRALSVGASVSALVGLVAVAALATYGLRGLLSERARPA